MKLLLDENLPHELRHELPGHNVFTIAYMKWTGIENGELLRVAAESDFDALITNDRGIEYEQSLESLPIAVVVLLVTSNTVEAIRPLLHPLQSALARLQPRQFVKIARL